MTEKEKKAKFLEHYFAVCREHGCCIDCEYDRLIVVPEREYGTGFWADVKQELLDDINN